MKSITDGEGGRMPDKPAYNGPVRIAVDAMGGDHAPMEIIKGALQAAEMPGVEIILVGPMKELERELANVSYKHLPLRLVGATEVIMDGDNPIIAVMRKPKSSMAVAAKLVKAGEADAMVSAGSTGAVMISALQYLGTLPGVDRPMVGGPFLQLAPNTFVLDMGANIGCQAYHLLNFAIAGSVFVKKFLGIESPTVGLLNVGVEEGKGNEIVKEAYSLLKDSGLNFVGNVEGMDIPLGKANVIVCDGFVGNIILKFCEGLGNVVADWLAGELNGKLPKEEADIVTSKLLSLVSPAKAAGGGPIWGVDGVAFIAHGSSRSEQVAAAIGQAADTVRSRFVETLKLELEKAQRTLANNSHQTQEGGN